jgi:hypothetical protein
MNLSNDEIRVLLHAVASTRDDEIGCDDCLAGVAAFAEAELAGRTRAEAHRRIQQHVDECPECREEYEALSRAMREL